MIKLLILTLVIIVGLATIHFSLANAQPGLSPLSTGHPPLTPTPTPTLIPPTATPPTSTPPQTPTPIPPTATPPTSTPPQTPTPIPPTATPPTSTPPQTPTPIPPTATPPPTPTPIPTGLIAPFGGPPGTSINAVGSNFAPGEWIEIKWAGQTIATVTARPDGRINAIFDAPNQAPATYVVTFGPITRTFTLTPSMMIHGCYKDDQGSLRIVDAAGACKVNETAVSWRK